MKFPMNSPANQRWRSLILLSLVAVGSAKNCRSSSEKVMWTQTTRDIGYKQGQREALEEDGLCSSQALQDAKDDAFRFLRDHVMKFDEAKLRTLGFGGEHSSAPDGLDNGLVGPTIDLALAAKMRYPWTDELPQDVFYEYVLNYANLNEGRSNWRPLFWDILHPMIRDQQEKQPLTPNDVVHLVNKNLWSAFPGNNTIYFKHGLTPLIYDPMSVVAFGHASCTGLAVLFVNALRTAGIAARVVGTPAWNSQPAKGNHNWVEVYDSSGGGGWRFLEPSANLTSVDDLATKPCSKWFCGPGRFPATGANETKVYAAGLVFDENRLHCPMPWEPDCKDVPGVDRTDYYQRVCSQC